MARNAAILAVAFVLGVGMAAGYDGVPGDPFYRAKRVAEQPVSLVNGDIAASNRVEELEELVDRGADPDTIASARSDAIRALAALGGDEELDRALSLVAWPGPLAGRGIDAVDADSGLLIPGPVWTADGGYTASLVDGHLVTVSASGDEILVAVTGEWASASTPLGWRLSNPSADSVYVIEQVGTFLRVQIVAPQTGDLPVDEAATSAMATFGDDVASPSSRPPGGPDTGPGPSPATSTTTSRSTGAAESRPGPPDAGGNAAPAPATTAPVSGAAAAPPTPATDRPATSTAATSAPPTSAPPTTTSGRPEADATVTTPAGPTTVTTVTVTAPTTAAPPSITSAPTPRAPTTGPPATAAPTTSTVPAPNPWIGYLTNPGSGRTSSAPVLPLVVGQSPGGSLANYDVDRDDALGLLIAKDGAGLGTGDRTKYQEWRWVVDKPTTIAGTTQLTIWLAAKDFASAERIGFLAAVDVCSSSCTRLGTGQWSAPSSGGFSRATVGFGTAGYELQPGDELRLRVAVHDSLATTDIWFAYDAAAYPSNLRIG
ncbi:MAG: hypothetical protein AAGA65_02165 [Actinomycetota bacterium]